jgi:hypothetical protein
MKKMLSGTVFTLLSLVSLQVQGDITGLRFTPMAKISEEDLAIYTEAMEDALNNIPDQQVSFWEDSNSGRHGYLTLVRSGVSEGRRCRLMGINNSVAHHSGRFHFNL